MGTNSNLEKEIAPGVELNASHSIAVFSIADDEYLAVRECSEGHEVHAASVAGMAGPNDGAVEGICKHSRPFIPGFSDEKR